MSGLDARIAKASGGLSSDSIQSLVKAKNQTFFCARQIGVKIASGSDPASAERHGKNAEELKSMTRRKLNPLEAIQAATISAADLLGYRNNRIWKVC